MPVEEVQPILRTSRKLRVLRQPLLEFRRNPRIVGQHVLRDLFLDVRLHIFLRLERGVEESPRGERIHTLWLEQRYRYA
jgi:hypothetical protein